MHVARLVVDGLRAGRRLRFIVRWGYWAYCKIAFLIACLSWAMLSRPAASAALVGQAALLITMFCCYAAFGYAVNSFSDMKVDAMAGKRNVFDQMPRPQSQCLIVIIAVAAVAAGGAVAAYYRRLDVAILVAAAYVVTACYSLPPVRLKARGLLGVVGSTLAQNMLPVVIIFSAFRSWNLASVSLCALGTMIGIRAILIHQAMDENADKLANVRTAATLYGAALVRATIKSVVFPLEMLALAATVAIFTASYPVVGVAAAVYLVLRSIQARFDDQMGPLFGADTFEAFGGMYYLCLPVVLAGYVAARDMTLWPVPVLALVWTIPRLRAEINVLRTIRRGIKRRRKARRRSRRQSVPIAADTGQRQTSEV